LEKSANRRRGKRRAAFNRSSGNRLTKAFFYFRSLLERVTPGFNDWVSQQVLRLLDVRAGLEQ
jgi:DNA-binding SARP family transcriptional activator